MTADLHPILERRHTENLGRVPPTGDRRPHSILQAPLPAPPRAAAHLPLGTLAANLVGGYLIGVAVAFFAFRPGLPPELRLFIVTGFLGGLTTFSSFSAEVVHLIDTARYAWAASAAALHVLGSLTMTALGMWSVQALRN